MGYRPAGLALVAALLTTLGSVQPGFTAAAATNAPDHLVKAGETLWSIGQSHGLAPEVIARANGLPSPDVLQVGQRLAIPGSRPATPPASTRPASTATDLHVVQAGETLWSIAQRHGLSVDAITGGNGLSDANRLQIGQRLRVPRNAAAPRPSGQVRAPSQRTRSTPRLRVGLAWPSRGVITSRFGFRWGRHHHGIDIAAPVGTPITAALDGTVKFAGWQGGYGRLVILDHGDGLTTYYGHASQLLVKVGDRVTKGQLVARVGATGNVTGPNLHFEVRRNTVPLDPLTFLQGRR